jgi:hypothetical protein
MADSLDDATGPSKVLNNARQSRTDLEVTGLPNDEAKLRKTLKDSFSQPNRTAGASANVENSQCRPG